MSGPHSPLSAWADRNPRVRWPLVLAAIVVLWGLASWIAGPDLAP